MAHVIWTVTALNSLSDIADYIALDHYEAARRLVRTVFDKVDLLANNPSLGTKPRDLTDTAYRRLVIKPLYVYYRTEGDNVVIIFVDRAERDFNIARFAR